jgi:hypothetical protein
MLHLQWTKTTRMKHRILCICAVLVISISSSSQVIHREEQDQKPYYFGLSLSGVYSRFQIEQHSSFLEQDSIQVAEPLNTPGISLRLVAALNLSPRFELRFNPGLIFTERPIQYQLKYPDFREEGGLVVKKNIESIITTFPLSLKFKSDRIGNFRVYMLGGGKMDFDLASKSGQRKTENQVLIRKMSYGIEAGMGFNFYRKSVTVSPEIKISSGLNNLHDRNPNLNYSRVLDRIQSRMIVFTIHLEG